jgi:hypothetical protein
VSPEEFDDAPAEEDVLENLVISGDGDAAYVAVTGYATVAEALQTLKAPHVGAEIRNKVTGRHSPVCYGVDWIRRITMKLIALLGALLLASPLSAEETKGPAAAEPHVRTLKERVSSLELALYPRPSERKRRMTDLNKLRNMAGSMVSGPQLPMKDDALDVYKLYRKGDLSDDEQFAIFRCERTGVSPTRAEVKAGNYDHFPYERWRGTEPPATGTKTPILWDRVAQADGTRLVAMSFGAVVVMPEAELQKLLKEHGQLTLTYNKNGVSFEYPRRFRISGKKNPVGTMLFVDDPATPGVDVMIGVHAKAPGFLEGMYVGIKKGVRVKTQVEETEIKEPIEGVATGNKLVYLRDGEQMRRVLRFLRISGTHSVTVNTELNDDAYLYPKLQSMLHSIKIETPTAKKPKQEAEAEFD